MQTEKDLLKKLELQISQIEQFVIDLQKDFNWQKVFYRNKLYLNLSGVFKKNYTEYVKYLENIIVDFNKLKTVNNKDLKLFYIEQLQNKIFALFKVLRGLKKYKQRKGQDLSQQISVKQQQVYQLEQQKQMHENMINHITKQYDVMHKRLVYGNDNAELEAKLLKLLGKQGELEKGLFSIKERLKLL